MYPNLMRSSCLNLLGYLPMRDGIPPRPALGAAPCGHARATNHVAAYSRVDGSLCHLGPAVHQRDVCLFDLAMSKLLGQLSVGQIRLSHQYQAACFFIQTMDNPWPQLTAYL